MRSHDVIVENPKSLAEWLLDTSLEATYTTWSPGDICQYSWSDNNIKLLTHSYTNQWVITVMLKTVVIFSYS